MRPRINKEGRNMKTKISGLLTVCLCLYLIACKSPTNPSDSTTSVFLPKSGEWTSAISIGRFDFTVSSDSTGIPKILVYFSKTSGSVSTTREPPWPITNRGFKIETTFSGAQWTFEGTFADSGDKASGTWKFVAVNTESGSWQASPKS